jgi:hypothetical protein
MSLYGYSRSTYSLKAEILAKLRELGATRMEASYSGGNDEGGVNEIRVLRPRGKTDYYLHHVRLHDVWEAGRKVGTEERLERYPVDGPYPNKREADAAARKKMKELPEWLLRFQPVVRIEPVKATDDLVRLFNGEGDYDEDDSLYRLVDDLLEGEFGTWAGEFSAHGTVFATVSDGRVWREGETSTASWHDSSSEY